jgi:hypothetical protein
MVSWKDDSCLLAGIRSLIERAKRLHGFNKHLEDLFMEVCGRYS